MWQWNSKREYRFFKENNLECIFVFVKTENTDALTIDSFIIDGHHLFNEMTALSFEQIHTSHY